MLNNEKYVEKLNGLLPLNHQIVGVQIIESKAEYDILEADELSRPMHYCVAVKSAMLGHRIKMSRFTAGCAGGNRALGITPPTENYYTGVRGAAMGLYRNESIAASVAANLPILPHLTYGVLVMPLEAFTHSPDVVLLTTGARNAMRILQGYTYMFGLTKNISLSGNQAVCIECTVSPLVHGDINVSMLCAGTRHYAQWADDEMMIGLHYKIFNQVVDGIEATVNPVESDVNKARIEDKLKAKKNLNIEVEYGKTYFKSN